MESRAITEDRTRVNAPSPRYTSGNRQAGRGFDLTISCGALLPRDRHESSRILTKTPLVNRLGPRGSPRDTSSKRILLEFMSVLAVKSYPLRDSETPPLLSLSLSSRAHLVRYPTIPEVYTLLGKRHFPFSNFSSRERFIFFLNIFLLISSKDEGAHYRVKDLCG